MNKKNNLPKMSTKRSLSNILFMLGIVMKYTPGYFVAMCLFEVYAAAEVFIEFTYASKYLLDIIETGGTFKEAVHFMLFILAIVMIKLLLAAVMENSVTPKAREKLYMKLRLEMYEKAVSLDLSRYDNPKYYNEFVWSISEASTRMDKILNDVGRLVHNMTRIVVNGIFFLAFDVLGIAFVIVSLIINVAGKSYVGRLGFARDAELKPVERKRSYFNRIFYLNDYAKEIRLNPVEDMLKDEFKQTNDMVYPIIDKYGKKQFSVGFLSSFIANDILITVVYLGYLVYKTVVLKACTYGSMIALFSASSTLKNSLRNVAMLFPEFEQHSLYVEKIRTFLAFESELISGDKQIEGNDFKELTIENIRFAYGEDKDTINDVSMSVKAGEKIAIVGYNGAGKSTLIKLILRLYDVNAGAIKVNGVNIKEYDKNCYRGLFATVFQDYKLFAATIADNVKMDNATEADCYEIIKALDESGFKDRLDTLEDGINTSLTREFDDKGVNLSGGEAQKVAIARTFYKYCPVIILDEPSSALDPISEYKLNEVMMQAAANKAVIFISHRLSSTVMADRIYMFENGRIIEQGSHEELMRLSGKYAEMFNLQAEKYRS